MADFISDYHSEMFWTSCVFTISVLATFMASSLTQNYSQVDKLWSILPIVYALIWSQAPACKAFSTLSLMFLAVLVWGLRLTINFYLRGGYHWPPWRGEEDYRWAVVQKWSVFCQKGHPKGTPKLNWVWVVFNFVFISLYQNILLLSIVAPVIHVRVESCSRRLDRESSQLMKDLLLFILLMVVIAFEALADHQRNVFHAQKLQGKVSGFCKTGLFACCRHPNYLCENLFWCLLCFFTLRISNPSTVLNCSWVGFIQYAVLFYNSINLTEQISVQRYGKEFLAYKKRVPMLLPKLPAKSD